MTKNRADAGARHLRLGPRGRAPRTRPGEEPPGAHTLGSVTAPANADVQRIRATEGAVYVNSNNLPSYHGSLVRGAQRRRVHPFPIAAEHRCSFREARKRRRRRAGNYAGTRRHLGERRRGVQRLDGASYKTRRTTTGGGPVVASVMQVSSASLEGGPVAPGSLVTAFASFAERG